MVDFIVKMIWILIHPTVVLWRRKTGIPNIRIKVGNHGESSGSRAKEERRFLERIDFRMVTDDSSKKILIIC